MRLLRWLLVLWLVGLVFGAVAPRFTDAAFSDSTSNPGNTFTAAADFGGTGAAPVRDLGTASCGNSSNSLSVPAGGVPVGNTLIARLAHRTTVNGAVTISDSVQNSWTKDADVFQGSIRIVVFSAYITKPLAQNDTITVTFPGVGDAVGLSVEEFSGIAATNRVDAVGTASGDSTSPSAALTTTNGNTVLFGAVASFNNRTYTEPVGWTTGKHQVIDCGGASRKADNHAASRLVSASGGYTYNPTISAGERWAAAIVAYRPASGAPSCSKPATHHLTGFELGPTVSPSTGLIDGSGSSAGTPLVESVVRRSGTYSLKVPKASGGTSYIDKAITSSSTAVFSFALRLESLPSADVSRLLSVNVSGTSSELDLEYNAAQNRFELAFGTDAATPASGVVQAGRWYYFDLRVAVGSSTWTADWRIDGVDQSAVSRAGTATTLFELKYGSDVSTDVFTAHYDDVFVSVTSGDYPLGDGRVLALRPNGEGASSTRTNFGNETGSRIGLDPHLRLDDDPMNSSADWLWQDTASSSSYVELTFQDASQTCIRGVTATVAYNASATGGNNGKTSIFSGTVERVVHTGDMSLSGTGIRYARTTVTSPDSTWTQSLLNGLVARIGYSTDVLPEPRWHALVIEYGVLP